MKASAQLTKLINALRALLIEIRERWLARPKDSKLATPKVVTYPKKITPHFCHRGLIGCKLVGGFDPKRKECQWCKEEQQRIEKDFHAFYEKQGGRK